MHLCINVQVFFIHIKFYIYNKKPIIICLKKKQKTLFFFASEFDNGEAPDMTAAQFKAVILEAVRTLHGEVCNMVDSIIGKQSELCME